MRRHIGCKEWETHDGHFYQESEVMQSRHTFLAICYNSFLNLFALNPRSSSHNNFCSRSKFKISITKASCSGL